MSIDLSIRAYTSLIRSHLMRASDWYFTYIARLVLRLAFAEKIHSESSDNVQMKLVLSVRQAVQVKGGEHDRE